MATTTSLKEQMKNAPTLTQGDPLKSLLTKDEVKKRFAEILGKRAAGFISSVLTVYNTNKNLKECDPQTILSSSVIAATLDLPVNSSLGFAHIVPYSGRAQFQMGWKGFVQLAIRTGQYETMNVSEVYDGELVSYNRLTGETELNQEGKISDKVIGYYAFFKLLNGFKKELYMTKEEVNGHGKKYSKSFGSSSGQWQQNFDAMAKKTVIKLLLSKWGILSIEMQRALTFDQATVVEKDGEQNPVYPDAIDTETSDAEKMADDIFEQKRETIPDVE